MLLLGSGGGTVFGTGLVDCIGVEFGYFHLKQEISIISLGIYVSFIY